MEPITVKYKVLDARAKVPAYATPGAAAADLCAVLDAPLTVAPMQRVQAVFFKVNTLGEESFLDDVKDLLEEILEE